MSRRNRTLYLWQEFYAWHPVRPTDESEVFWLETVWRRVSPVSGQWEYRSFRGESAKQLEMMTRAF